MKKIYVSFAILFCLAGQTLKAQSPQLWGLTTSCGSNNYGSIIKINEDGTGFENMYSFDILTGMYPSGSLLMATDGKLYGLAQYGGADTVHHEGYYKAQGSGVIFSFDPVFHVYTDLYNFDFVHGAEPTGALIQLSNGKLYGTCNWGGLDSSGTLFSFDPVTHIYTDLYDFATYLGSSPNGTLVQASNGKLYGTTWSGGDTSGNGYGGGTIFSIDTTTNIVTELYSFSLLTGYNPEENLIQASNGLLYGVTLEGGDTIGNPFGYGVIFSFDPSTNIYSDVYNCSLEWGFTPLIQATNNKLYGLDPNGIVFSFNISNNSISNVGIIGTPSSCLVQGSNGKLYGSNYGFIFGIDTVGNDTTILHNWSCSSGALIELPASTGIQQIQQQNNEVTVYPNPTSGTFTLSCNQLGITNYELGIYDVLGQQVYTQLITLPTSSESSLITLPQLSNGVYFYQITNDKETYRGKFVKE